MELTRKIIRVGNSAGVLLPKEWYGGEAKVILVEKPAEIEKDILKLLSPYLSDTIGIYLVGSYARKEERSDSDIDILVISSKLDKNLNYGKYKIMILSLENIKKILLGRVLPIYPMIHEAKTILNNNLLEELKKIRINRESLNWHIDTTESALKIAKNLIELSKDDKEISGNIVYSLILRLRELYLTDCILKDRLYKTKDFLLFLRENNISKRAYEDYLKEKEGIKAKGIDIIEAEKIYNLANKLLDKQKCQIRKKH